MKDRIVQLEGFFKKYEENFNKALSGIQDPDVTTNFFADSFIGANPQGIMCGNNNQQFRSVIVKGYEFYRDIGITSMHIDLCTVTLLDDLHEMSKIQWRCKFKKKDGSGGDIVFQNIHFTQTKHEPKIFAYITGNEQEALKTHGLI